MWLRCRNLCTQTPCRFWQVEYCLHSRLFPILRFSQPNTILILVVKTRLLSDYSHSQIFPRLLSISNDSDLTSLPLISNQSQTTPYAQIISRLLPMLKLFSDYSQTSLISDHSKTKRLLPFSGDSQTTPYSNYFKTTQYFKIILRLLPVPSLLPLSDVYQTTLRLLQDKFQTSPYSQITLRPLHILR